MQRQKSLKGAARLGPTGAFELYLGGGQGAPRMGCISEPLSQFIKEYWDFLMAPETERQIGDTTAYKRRTSTGKMMVSFTFLGGFNVRLIRGDGEFATFILEVPFMGAQDAGDDDQSSSFGDAYEGMGDPDASFGDESPERAYAGEEGSADGA